METNQMENATIVIEKIGDKEVVYGKATSGKLVGTLLRVYYIRPKDNVVVGRNIITKKAVAVGAGSMSEEFRAHFNIVSKRKTKDITNVLEKFNTTLNEFKAAEVEQEQVQAEAAPDANLVEVTKAPRQRKAKK